MTEHDRIVSKHSTSPSLASYDEKYFRDVKDMAESHVGLSKSATTRRSDEKIVRPNTAHQSHTDLIQGWTVWRAVVLEDSQGNENQLWLVNANSECASMWGAYLGVLWTV